MAVKEFRVGPRSRVLEAEDAKNALLGAKVMGGLLGPDEEAPVAPAASQAVPGPIAESLRSCGCGRQHIPHSDDPEEAVEVDGIVHRYSRACYRIREDGSRGYYDFETYRTPEQRLADAELRLTAVEKVLADLLKRQG